MTTPAQSQHPSREHDIWDGLHVDDVTKTWEGATRPVLDGVNLHVAEGALVWVVGSNGAGKTTLLRIIAGLLEPEDGTVTLNGLHPRRDQQRYFQELGLVSAGDRGLYARLNTIRHLTFWARLAMLARDQRGQAIEQVIDRFELHDLLAVRVDRLSMGQRQRLRFALAMLHRPRLLLLDEPTSSLDSDAIELLDKAILQLLGEGGSCIWISPGNEQVNVPVSDRLRLDRGKLVGA